MVYRTLRSAIAYLDTVISEKSFCLWTDAVATHEPWYPHSFTVGRSDPYDAHY